VGGVGEQRYKQRQSAVAHVIIVHVHDPVLSSLKMKGIRLLFLMYVQNTQMHSVVIKQMLNVERGGISGKGKGKVYLRTGHEVPKGNRGIALPFL
jgi:hypothetical protein